MSTLMITGYPSTPCDGTSLILPGTVNELYVDVSPYQKFKETIEFSHCLRGSNYC